MTMSDMESNHITKERSGRIFFTFSHFLMIILVLMLLSVGIIFPLSSAGTFGTLGLYTEGAVIGLSIIAIIVILRQNEFAAVYVIAVSLCLDWYLGTLIAAQVIGLIFLAAIFLTRSSKYPWTEPSALWLWALFLGLAIFPSIRGATNRFDAFYYYPNLILGAVIMFWFGTVIARNITSVRRFFQIFAGFGTLIAIHLLIEAVTGRFLFLTTSQQTYLASVSDYQLGTTGVSRLASFFLQPDAGSTFFALMLFIPLGLFVESSSLLKKFFYFIEALLILFALLLTYSAAAWLAAGVGVVIFLLLVGSMFYRVQFLFLIITAASILFLGFSSQISLLLQHASNPLELLQRIGLWQTAWQVIRAFPLTGVGLGRFVYLQRAEPYRVPAEFTPTNNPHNSYLEWGAMAGLPVLFVFLALLALALWQALCIWTLLDRRTRSLIAAGIASTVVLCVDSWSFGSWTLPPLAASGWLLLGVISSPLLTRSLNDENGLISHS